MFKGAITAIVTPFKNGQFDEAAYRELIEFQIEGGVHGIVPCGTTGESPTLSHAEHKRVVETCIDQVKKRVVVIAGSGSNSTAESLELTKHAQAAGADAALIAARLGQVESPVTVHTRGGEALTVYFTLQGEAFAEVFLEGDALVAYQGELWVDELK